MGNTQGMTQKITRKERGKQHKYQLKYQNIPIKIKILLAYLEKILYLCGIFFAEKKMNDLRLSVYAVVRAHSKTEY